MQRYNFILDYARLKWIIPKQEATSKLINHFYADIPFVDICGQRDGIMIKPDPAVVYHLIDLAQVDRSEVLYIGDSGVDMQTAVNADVTSCGVTWGFRPLSELTENGAVYIANHPNEIYKLICHLDESI
jgi:phosphoglycolate phosphatase